MWLWQRCVLLLCFVASFTAAVVAAVHEMLGHWMMLFFLAYCIRQTMLNWRRQADAHAGQRS